MRILLLGLNYAPELVGIGPYTEGLARFLVDAGHKVTVVCAKPYYPAWTVDSRYRGIKVVRTAENGVTVIRIPLYVPGRPDGLRRLLHHLSFAIIALPTMLLTALQQRPDVVIGIAPSLISLIAARITASLFKTRLWIHIQDFEVEAAFATGLLRSRGALAGLAQRFERWSLRADCISTISAQMRERLIDRGIVPEKAFELRNWASIDLIRPLDRPSVLRQEWEITRKHIALYSGNIANKQGTEIIVQAAWLLLDRTDLLFIICGEGANRSQLEKQAVGLNNILFVDLQPTERLSELLGLASVHLLPQIAGAADLVLPSKLTNMLASGRPIVATAERGTGIATEVDGCGIVVPPADPQGMAAAIRQLIDDNLMSAELGRAARARAEERFSKNAILGRFEISLRQLAKR